MINPNYMVDPSESLDYWLGISISSLDARDSHVVLQMMFNFSSAIGLLNSGGESPRIVETGSGFSTQIFYTLISKGNPGQLISIDFGDREAAENNSRHLVDLGTVFESDCATLVAQPTIDLQDLEAVYGGGGAPASWRPSGLNVSQLAPFVELRLDDRRRTQIERATKNPFNIDTISHDVLDRSLSDSAIFNSYRSASDEFDFLKSTKSKGALANLLRKNRPNLIFLDSGEFSTLAEFLVVDDLAEMGTIILVHDIVFPKSIKGFLIGALLTASPKWEILWVDRSTPQGMLAAVRKQA